jgi:hypothetical protein
MPLGVHRAVGPRARPSCGPTTERTPLLPTSTTHTGLSLLHTLFSLSHRRACPMAGRLLGNTILCGVCVGAASYIYLRAQSLNEVSPAVVMHVCYPCKYKSSPAGPPMVGRDATCVSKTTIPSKPGCFTVAHLNTPLLGQAPAAIQTLGPNWLAGRVTELFSLVTTWAIKVRQTRVMLAHDLEGLARLGQRTSVTGWRGGLCSPAGSVRQRGWTDLKPPGPITWLRGTINTGGRLRQGGGVCS